MARRKASAVPELVRVAEIDSSKLPTDQVKIVETAEKIAEINNKKVVKENVEPQVDVASVVQQAIKAANKAQEIKLTAAIKAKDAQLDAAIKAIEERKEDEIAELKAVVEELKASSNEQVAAVNEVLKTTKSELETAKENEKRIADLFKLHGSANPVKERKTPALNTVTTTDSDRVFGSLSDLESIQNSTQLVLKQSSQGNPIWMRDFKPVDHFVRENRKQVMNDLEVFAKKNGLLQGGSVNGMAVKEAATQISDVPGGFLQTLSSIIRTTHRPGYVFWQFAQTEFNYLKSQGTTVLVQRAAYQPSSIVPSDWLLSGGGSFTAIDTNLQQISTGTVPIVLQEFGLGKGSGYTTEMPPVSLPSFVLAYSMIDLVSVLEKNLGQNYAQFEERTIRALYNGSSAVVYNSASNVVTSPSAIVTSSATNDSGIITKEFLLNLNAYMRSLLVEPFPDNNYALVLHPLAVSQLMQSLQTIFRMTTVEDVAALSNILNPTVIPPENGSRISGYIGTYYGFHIFQSNGFSVGVTGNEGVQTETILSGSKLTRISYAFGNSAVGRGVGTPMEIRQNEITNYQRLNSYIWRSEEGFAALDVDPTGYSDTSTVPQQLRVFLVHTTDSAL